jgi:TatD DNase family protein
LTDTHCHLTDPQFDNDREQVLVRARAAGVRQIINAGYDVETSQKALHMAQQTDWLMPAVGIHPHEASKNACDVFDTIEKLSADSGVVAIGETGLDYYREFASAEQQQLLFRKHIALARRMTLPLLIHTRKSIDAAIDILKQEDFHTGVFHCYSGSYEQACVILDMGFYLGFGGVLTFSVKVQEVFKKIPADRILLETDSPYLAPVPYRGKRNEPAYIMETVHFAAHTLGIKQHLLEKKLDDNVTALFHS